MGRPEVSTAALCAAPERRRRPRRSRPPWADGTAVAWVLRAGTARSSQTAVSGQLVGRLLQNRSGAPPRACVRRASAGAVLDTGRPPGSARGGVGVGEG